MRKDQSIELGVFSPPVRAWFSRAFPNGPTSAQSLAWPVIAGNEHVLLVSPTGTGKTLAAFLAILDKLFREAVAAAPQPGPRAVYVSPLRSLANDINSNLLSPIEGISRGLGLEPNIVRVAVRTGDTPARVRAELRDEPPHILITTPESLSLLLSQTAWTPHWKHVEHIVVDEIHSLAPTKRGADLAVSIERLAASANREPARIGLSATCGPAAVVARFLAGPARECAVVEAPPPSDEPAPEISVESLVHAGEAAYRPLAYRRLGARVRREIERNRTTIVFANTRAFTERLTHDLSTNDETIAAHHSSLDPGRRSDVESDLKSGRLRAVITSTSLELGVDIGTADVAMLLGVPGSVARCLQRVGRAGHRVGAKTRGVLLCATPAELCGAVVASQLARANAIEPLSYVHSPLDVLCQQLVGMACASDCSIDGAFALVRQTAPFQNLERRDFDDCLAYLAGQLASPPGVFEPEPGAEPRWTSPRLWRVDDFFGLRSPRVRRWFWQNVGTIHAEETVDVVAGDFGRGTVEASFAESLQPGDRFLLDGRSLQFRKLDGSTLLARETATDATIPRWSSDRQSLSPLLAERIAAFRAEAGRRLVDGSANLRAWLVANYALDAHAVAVLHELFEAQELLSEIPDERTLLVEESADEDDWTYAFHAPLGRAACEAMARAVAARLGRLRGVNLALAIADMGWMLRVPSGSRIDRAELEGLLSLDHLEADVLAGVDRGELIASRFRRVAATALMVLRRADRRAMRVGGTLWASRRLFPLVRATCPDHPLIRETKREALEQLLDTPRLRSWLRESPTIRWRRLEGASPFTAAWIDPAPVEPLRFESPLEALKRLHARIHAGHAPAIHRTESECNSPRPRTAPAQT